MKNATKRLRNGTLLFLVLASVEGCRKDPPPEIPICLGDGFGGCNGTDATGELAAIGCQHIDGGDGNRYYCPPSLMKNFWTTTETGMKNYSAWAYGGSTQEVQPSLDQIRKQIGL